MTASAARVAMPPKRATGRKVQKSASKPRPKAKPAGKLKATTGKKRFAVAPYI